jgi:hypothetical protein
MDDSRLPRKAYIVQRQLAERGVDCWGKQCSEILADIGMTRLWNDEIGPRLDVNLRAVKREMMKLASTETHIQATGKISLTEYLSHRCVISYSTLDKMPVNVRGAITSVRLGVPTLFEKVTVDETHIWRCSLCKQPCQREWKHIFSDCASIALENRPTDGYKICLEGDPTKLTEVGEFLIQVKKIVQEGRQA